MKVIIVESPTKAQPIQKYVGDDYMVCSSNGQIVDLAKGGRFGIGINPLKEFKPYYCLIAEKMNFLDQIISRNEKIDEIIIATDPDTEGHGIAWHIGQKLSHLHKPLKRAEFHEITKKGIEEGLSKKTELSLNKFKAQETRRILDRIVGFMVSPFLINYYGDKLSAGRVQSVATKMVIEREKEINNFQKEEYWNVLAKLKKDGKLIAAKYTGKIHSEKEANELKTILESPSIEESEFEVVKVSRKEKRELPPPPLTTAKMQQLMASKYSIEGEETMAAAQVLYELGFVTYIRTDSVRISDDAIKNVRTFIQNNKLVLPHKPHVFKNKEAAQNAHECIRPTNIELLPKQLSLKDTQNKLYDLIWKTFVASQMEAAIYDTLSVQISHSSGKKFKVSGKALISPGYLKLSANRTESKNELPNLVEKEILHLDSVQMEQKFTQPPARYNYSTLVEELDSKGIGRPSTLADIIGKITNRNYVNNRDNMYYGTELGAKITFMLDEYFEFMNYDYTANLEKDMDEVAEGTKDSLDVLNNFYNLFIDKLKIAHQTNGGKCCQECNSPIYERTSFDGNKFFSCALYPFCSGLKKEKFLQAS